MDKNMIALRPEVLIEARYDFSSKENDLFDMILTAIKPDDNLEYIIELSDYLKYYDSTSAPTNITRDFEKTVKGIRSKGFEISTKSGEWSYFNMFSQIDYRKGKVKFTLTPQMKIFFIELKKRIYYDIEHTLNFKCKYSKRLYYFLKSFEDTGWRRDNIEQLRKKLKCPESYSKFSDFKKNVLNPAYDEINKSDINFEYEEIKNSRGGVQQIQFNIKSVQKKNISTDDSGEKKTIIKLIKNVIKEPMPDNVLWDLYSSSDICNKDISILFKAYEATEGQDIRDLVPWLKSMCQKVKSGSYIPPIAKRGKKKTNGFNDYDQREYNMKDLERKLRGIE
jgi:plasmid replication initiation protein